MNEYPRDRVTITTTTPPPPSSSYRIEDRPALHLALFHHLLVGFEDGLGGRLIMAHQHEHRVARLHQLEDQTGKSNLTRPLFCECEKKKMKKKDEKKRENGG